MSCENKQIAKSFLQDVWDLYAKAESLTVEKMPIEATRIIKRGRSHCISGLIEDAFALLIYNAVHPHCATLRIWIDTPVSVGKINGRVKTIYPDILVTKELPNKVYEVVHVYELKSNTGWMRDCGGKVVGKMCESLDWMTKSATTKLGDSESEKTMFKITDRTRYDLVLLTSVNNKPGKAEEIVRQARQVPGGRIGGWLLCDQELCPKHADPKKATRETVMLRQEFLDMLHELVGQFNNNPSQCVVRED